MASIYKTLELQVAPEQAWDAIRDVGALHLRLVRGFVSDTRLEGDLRTVTFANGMTVQERIVALDSEHRRLAYTVVGGRASHHHAYVQVHAGPTPTSCRIVWVTDLLPDALAEPIGQMMQAGVLAMQRTLENENAP